MTKAEREAMKAAYLAHMEKMVEDEEGKIVGLPSIYTFLGVNGYGEEEEKLLRRDEKLMHRAKELRSLALLSAMLTKRVDSTAAWHIIDKSGFVLTDEFTFEIEADVNDGEVLTNGDRALLQNLALRLGFEK